MRPGGLISVGLSVAWLGLAVSQPAFATTLDNRKKADILRSVNKVSNAQQNGGDFRTGHRDLMREINQKLLLNLIRAKGPISRADLAKRTRLSPATVSQIVQVLLDSQFITEIGEGTSSGGRRPTLLKIEPSAGFVAGLKLSEGSASVAVTDLGANVLHFTEDPVPTHGSAAATLASVNALIERALKDSGVDRKRLLGIGIGLGGVIDADAGVCRHSTILNWRDVDVASPVHKRFGLPVFVDNDVNTLTTAEQWFGHGRGIAHFVVITVGRGVGMGIVTNGQFYRGASGGAGELGHTQVSQLGTLEELAADPSVVKRVAAARKAGPGTATKKTAQISRIMKKAMAGDEISRAALAEAGHWLGVGIANVINVLNPELVIVGGEGVEAGPLRLDPMFAAIERFTYAGLGKTRIVIEFGGNQTWARGAASLVLDKVFQAPITGGLVS